MTKSLILAFFCCFFALQAAQAQQIEFETLEINYGDIEKGANGVREFRFKNVGKEALIIEGAVPSCGCTIPDYPREPIMPGESRAVKVKYDTQRLGAFAKMVTLKSNSVVNSQTVLSIRGNVLNEPVAVPNKGASLMNGKKLD